MSLNRLRPEQGSTPPFVKPFLHALNRMQERERLRPDQLTDRAQVLLNDRFGISTAGIEATFCHGPVSLLSDHTLYFGGFALMMPLSFGTAVAVRSSSDILSRVVFEGRGEVWAFDRRLSAEIEAEDEAAPAWVEVVMALARALGPAEAQVEVAVVSTVPAVCVEAYLAALGMAAARVLQALFALAEQDEALIAIVQAGILKGGERPLSIAYLLAARAAQSMDFILIDSQLQETLPVEAPSDAVLGWGLVDVGRPDGFDVARYERRKKQVARALTLLQRKDFPHLTSFRELYHHDLQQALDALPRRLKPLIRHLVTENGRVQKLVAAIRRRDWQMFGALLLMSHASRSSEWRDTDDRSDFVVNQIEGMSLEGMYGAYQAGRGGGVLIVGQPFMVLRGLDRIAEAFEARFGETPETLLL